MVVKALDVKFVLVPQGALRVLKVQALRGAGGMPPKEIFKIEHSETLLLAFLRQGWSSLKFSLSKLK